MVYALGALKRQFFIRRGFESGRSKNFFAQLFSLFFDFFVMLGIFSGLSSIFWSIRKIFYKFLKKAVKNGLKLTKKVISKL